MQPLLIAAFALIIIEQKEESLDHSPLFVASVQSTIPKTLKNIIDFAKSTNYSQDSLLVLKINTLLQHSTVVGTYRTIFDALKMAATILQEASLHNSTSIEYLVDQLNRSCILLSQTEPKIEIPLFLKIKTINHRQEIP